MKHLKLYEKKFTKNSLKIFSDEKDKLYELIKEYSIINDLYKFGENVVINNFYYEHDIREHGDEAIIVTVINNYSSKEENPYMIENLDDLNEYIEDPEIYNSTKKYNL